jgi:Nucleoside-diphosphate-sugar epimerases
LGNTLAKRLVEDGQRVRGLIQPQESDSPALPREMEVVTGNILDPASMEPLFQHEPDEPITVIHNAGLVSIATKYQQNVYDVNVTGTKNILRLCRQNGAVKLVYVSSVHAIPELPMGQIITETKQFDPDKVNGCYAKTKAAATACVLTAGAKDMDVCIIHPSGLCGPNDYGRGHITQLLIDYCRHSLTSGVATGGYDFVDVRDVADGVIAAADKGKKGECYILSNRYIPVRELLNTLSRVTGGKNITTVLPLWFAKMTAPLAELYYKIRHESPLFTRYTLYTLTSNARFTYEKARRDLGYKPRDISTTIKDTVSFLTKERKNLFRKRKVSKPVPVMG